MDLKTAEEQAAMPHVAVETGWAKIYRKQFNVIWGTVSVALFFFLWEVVIRSGWIDPFFISYPSQVAKAMTGYLFSSEFVTDISVSSAEYLLGLGLSIAIGIPLGIAIGWYRFAYALLHPVLFAFYVVPHVAFLPLIIMWFGIGVPAKALYVFFSGVFPVIYNTATALNTVDPRLLSAARSFKATDLQIFRTVALPGSVPVILAGVRLSAGKCLTGVVVAEFWAAFSGVGNMISRSGAFYLVDKMYVGIIVIACLGIAITEVMRIIENRFDDWRVTEAK